MDHPTTRVLALLEMLQAQGRLSGAEIAERLQVDVRTVRHYVTLLLEMGIPVEAVRGRYGGYRLLPGFKLPPLMFTEKEALALMLGLKAAEQLGLTVAAPATAGARAKLERVLPVAVRDKLESALATLVIEGTSPYLPPPSDLVLALSNAAQQQRHVRVRYRAWQSGETERTIAPYGIVNYQGRWFVAGRCCLRDALRVFRLDRIVSAEPEQTTFTRPADFDCLAHVIHSLATTPGTWKVEVWMNTTIERARLCISPAMATLEEESDGIVLRCWVQDIHWLAHVLCGMEWECIIRHPPELRDALRKQAQKASAMADRI